MPEVGMPLVYTASCTQAQFLFLRYSRDELFEELVGLSGVLSPSAFLHQEIFTLHQAVDVMFL